MDLASVPALKTLHAVKARVGVVVIVGLGRLQEVCKNTLVASYREVNAYAVSVNLRNRTVSPFVMPNVVTN
ncbi:hypothetical protein DOU54_14260 [Agrobacterium sp. MS2]|nr:hypothetical protein DOU54_14260 [Agrobacterium sp. MS2]